MNPDMAMKLIEVLVGILAIAFAGWAGVVWKASQNLSAKFDNMMTEFRRHVIATEHRVTKLEAEAAKILELLEERRDRE